MTAGKPPKSGAIAGMLLVSTVLFGVAVGFGVGAVTGSIAVFSIVGGFIGLIAGFRVVYSRFKDI